MLKIKICPAFMSQCDFEIKNNQFIVIKSSNSEYNDSSEAFHSELQSLEVFDELMTRMLSFISNPSPKKIIVIADGISIKIHYSNDEKNIEYELKSIQKDSKEMKFVHDFFDLSMDCIKNDKLTTYLKEVKENYLSQ